MTTNKLFSFVTVLGLIFFAVSCGGDGDEAADAEQTPESIIENAVFTDLDGNDVSIQDFAGKVVVIDFWESWCGPCLQVFPSLDELRGEYPDDFEVLAVTIGMTEGPDEAKAFAEKNGYDFNFLYDEYGVYAKLGIVSIPYKAYVAPDGTLIKTELGSYGPEGNYNRTKALIQEHL